MYLRPELLSHSVPFGQCVVILWGWASVSRERQLPTRKGRHHNRHSKYDTIEVYIA